MGIQALAEQKTKAEVQAQQANAEIKAEYHDQTAKLKSEAERKIAEEKARADEAAEEIAKVKTETEALIAKIKAEYKQQLAGFKAEAEAAKARENARAEAQLERDRILADLRGQISALAMAAAQRLIGEALDESRQHALIEEFFSGVKTGQVVVLEGKTISGAAAEVTSALPLSSMEQETVKNDILSKIGEQATVTFRVDPNILGGIIIRVGDKVLDGSAASQLEELRQELQ